MYLLAALLKFVCFQCSAPFSCFSILRYFGSILLGLVGVVANFEAQAVAEDEQPDRRTLLLSTQVGGGQECHQAVLNDYSVFTNLRLEVLHYLSLCIFNT
jgi:hypothetical protein